jgi:CRISPR-associated protein Csd1
MRPDQCRLVLDPEYRQPGYLLGRLFATFDHAGYQASGSRAVAMRYAGASATPSLVFPRLQDAAAHHLARLHDIKPARGRLIAAQLARIHNSIGSGLSDLPALGLAQQALFAIGCYHQRHAFHHPGGAEASGQASSEVRQS